MRSSTRTGIRTGVVVTALVLVSACGGDDDTGGDSDSGDAPVAADDTDDTDDADGAGATVAVADDDRDPGGDDAAADDAGGMGSGQVTLGTPTITADPGTAIATVGDEQLTWVAAGSIHFECTIAADRVTVNFQTAEGHDFLVQGSPQTGDWFLSATFASGADDNVQYGVDSTTSDGVFTVGEGALSYEGVISKVVDRDIMNPEDVDGTFAANCASAGGDPSAEIDGQSFTWPLSGAQSVTCVVEPETIDVLVNRLAVDDSQLQISGRIDGGNWVGAVSAWSGAARFSSTLPIDGTGLTLDGSSLTYEGTFTDEAGGEFPGTVSITC